jgi:predicted PolB exonuclease-like 3'-5' exonuclease
MNLFVFDIETIPDTQLGRLIYDLKDLDDAAVIAAMLHLHRQTSGSEFLKLYLHKIVTISVALKTPSYFNVWSLGDETSDEKELLERFFDGIQKYSPTLVSWNGSGFDLPVIHYRSLIQGVSAPRYWETGDEDTNFRWNNYLNRFHYRHTDLMDVLAGYQNRANAPLDEIALALGLPGKMGMSGGKVWQTFLAGDRQSIRDYCETDVLNTYLIYERFELLRGKLTLSEYQTQCEKVRQTLLESGKPHLQRFCDRWKEP